MPGASGIVGAQAAARAAPDGYTLFFANASALTSNMIMIKSIPYDPARDFSAVAMVCSSGPFVVVVTPGLPVKSLPELLAYGKANPGKLSYAVDATSGFGMVAGKLLNKRSGLGMVEVPYRVTAQMLQDLAAGTVSVAISTVAPTEGFAKAGKLRRIAITSEKRFPGLDDLPTVGETLPQFVIDGWFAVVAPTGTPTEIVRRLQPGDRTISQPRRHQATAPELRPRDNRARHAGVRRQPSSEANRNAGAVSRASLTCRRNKSRSRLGNPPYLSIIFKLS